MPVSIVIIRPGSRENVDLTTTTMGLDPLGEDRTVVTMRVKDEIRDLQRELVDGDEVGPILADSDEGLSIIRHSAAHVTAQALQHLFAEAKLGIGPPVTDGFYYGFATSPLTPEDLKAIERRMGQIVREKQHFVRREVSGEEAREELAAEPFKLELIADRGGASAVNGSSVEVGEGQLIIYDNVRRDGSVAWHDLRRGPHVSHTGYLQAFMLTKSSAAYWRGDQRSAGLQHIYGTAWATRKDLKAYQTRIAETARRDHRKLGTELGLFSFPDEIGSELAVFRPDGAMVRMEMEDYSRYCHVGEGYQFAYIPRLTKASLFQTSGHLDWYTDGVYPPIHMDEECGAQGNIRRQGQDYYLRPMNCPVHSLIFRSRGRSYRELPLRLFEPSIVYRNEKSGVVHGLTRTRKFAQDDAHIYCTRGQMCDKLTGLLTFVLNLFKDCGLDDFYLELSTKNPEKFVDDDETQEEATSVLTEMATASGLELVPDPGGTAFYDPKVSVQAKGAIGHTWQMSTIQFDLNLPGRLGPEYQTADGTRQRPVMVYRAPFGSIERFFGVLTEHYAGTFPTWLAPVQVLGVPVANEFSNHPAGVATRLRAHGVRVELDFSDDRFGKKIRNVFRSKVPSILIAGGEDHNAGAVSFRFRDGSQLNGVPIEQAMERVRTHIASRSNTDSGAR